MICLLLTATVSILLLFVFQVLYQSDQFLDKNKDYVVPEHQDLLGVSKCPFVAGLFPPLPEETSKSSKFSSIGSRFKASFLVLFSDCILVVFILPTRVHVVLYMWNAMSFLILQHVLLNPELMN